MGIASGLRVTAIRTEGKLLRTAEPGLGLGPKTVHRKTRKGYHKKSLVMLSSFAWTFGQSALTPPLAPKHPSSI
jgi:hypothetical protein